MLTTMEEERTEGSRSRKEGEEEKQKKAGCGFGTNHRLLLYRKAEAGIRGRKVRLGLYILSASGC